MRKVVSTFFIAGALTMTSVGLASGAKTPHRSGARCGTLYTATCRAPQLSVRPLSLACHRTRTRFSLPVITATSNAGLRSVKVKLDSRTLVSKRFKGNGPTQYVIHGLRIDTAGLPTGMHTLTLTTVDIRGKRVSRTLRFTICKPVPKFTG